MSQDAWDLREAPDTDATGPRPCGWALVIQTLSPINRAKRENVWSSVHTSGIVDRTMTDEGEMKSGQIEEAACRPPRQRAAFPASKYTCTQTLPMLRNLQFARWTLKNAYTTHVHVSMFKGNLESDGDRETERE